MSKSMFYPTLLLLVVCAALPVSASAGYSVTDLGPIGVPNAINSSGQVCGLGDCTGCMWSHGTAVNLQPSGTANQPRDINAYGVMAGVSNYAAATWDSNGAITYLQVPTGITNSMAVAINDSGLVVGQYVGSDALPCMCYWDKDGIHSICLPDGLTGVARDVDNNGNILLDACEAGGFLQSYVHGNAGLTLIGDDNAGIVQTVSSAMNDGGMVVGSADHDGVETGFFWQGGKTTLLDTLSGDTSRATGVNASGIVVGYAFIRDASPLTERNDRACIWDGGQFVDLNSLIDQDAGWKLSAAFGINDSGQIIGSGKLNGVNHAFLLTPVPEPSSLAALVAGMGCLGALIRRRQRP